MKIIKIGKADNNDIVITGDSTVSRLYMQMFIDDEANGKWTRWYENGQIESEKYYKDGVCISGC